MKVTTFRFSFCVVIPLTALLLVSCGTPPKPTPEPNPPQETVKSTVTPYDLQADASNAKLTVSWKTRGEGLISGYSIYISPELIVGRYPDTMLPSFVHPYNSTPYPGDTNPDDSIEQFVAEGLENGVKYYVSVRVLYPDGRLSLPSNEVAAVCGPRGEMELGVRYSSQQDGFSFDNNGYVSADFAANDLYFYTVDGHDYIASPNRLDGYLRATKFKIVSLPNGLKDAHPGFGQFELPPTADKVEVRPGDWVWARTPEKRSAILQVVNVIGKGNARRVGLTYAYCPLAGELIF